MITGDRLIIVLASGDTETWTRERDQLSSIELHQSGALIVHRVESPGVTRIAAVRAFGTWLAVEVEEP